MHAVSGDSTVLQMEIWQDWTEVGGFASHFDLDDLLGELDLPIQESIIIRKSAGRFLLSTQKEI